MTGTSSDLLTWAQCINLTLSRRSFPLFPVRSVVLSFTSTHLRSSFLNCDHAHIGSVTSRSHTLASLKPAAALSVFFLIPFWYFLRANFFRLSPSLALLATFSFGFHVWLARLSIIEDVHGAFCVAACVFRLYNIKLLIYLSAKEISRWCCGMFFTTFHLF